MPNVKQALVSKVDRCLVQHLRRDHAERDRIPSSPQRAPLVASRRAVGVARLCILSRRERKWGTLEEVQRAARRDVEGCAVYQVHPRRAERVQRVEGRKLVVCQFPLNVKRKLESPLLTGR